MLLFGWRVEDVESFVGNVHGLLARSIASGDVPIIGAPASSKARANLSGV